MRLTSEILKDNKRKLIHAFPTELKDDVNVVADYLTYRNFDIHPTVQQEVVLDKQALIIPGRVYFDEPKETTGSGLTDMQQTILKCIYLRHHNGFVRQSMLEKLIKSERNDYFIIPYVFQLLGEYVIEILFVLSDHITDKTIDQYLKFKMENPKYWQQTESRMISYWNAYYRGHKYRQINDYIGQKIFDRLNISERPT